MRHQTSAINFQGCSQKALAPLAIVSWPLTRQQMWRRGAATPAAGTAAFRATTLRSVAGVRHRSSLAGAFALLALLLVIALVLASSIGAANVSWRAALNGDLTA